MSPLMHDNHVPPFNKCDLKKGILLSENELRDISCQAGVGCLTGSVHANYLERWLLIQQKFLFSCFRVRGERIQSIAHIFSFVFGATRSMAWASVGRGRCPRAAGVLSSGFRIWRIDSHKASFSVALNENFYFFFINTFIGQSEVIKGTHRYT